MAYAVADKRETWVFLEGRTYVIAATAEGPVRPPSSADEQAALSSPMPATVTKVNVIPGQTVERGDVMIVLEAMKMELPVKAPRDGIVRTVTCKVADLVQAGLPLVNLE